MTQQLYVPNEGVTMSPIEGFRFYAEAVRGDWSVDGRSIQLGIEEYVNWAMDVDATKTTEAEVLDQLRRCLGVYVIEEFNYPDYHDRRGIWAHHIEDLLEAEGIEI